MEASVILADNLLQLFMGEVAHSVQTKGDLLGRLARVREVLIRSGVACRFRGPILLLFFLELLSELFFKLFKHAARLDTEEAGARLIY